MSTDSVTLQAHYLKADRIMLGVIWFLLGLFLRDRGVRRQLGTGAGHRRADRRPMTALYLLIPGQRLLRCLIGAAFMVLAALQINQAHGLLEMHFGIFALLAFLVYYRDWLPIVVAAATIAVHHLSFLPCSDRARASIWCRTEPGAWCSCMPSTWYWKAPSSHLAIRANAEAREGEALLGAAAAITAHPERIDLSRRSRAQWPGHPALQSYAGPARRTGRRGGARHRQAGRHRGQPEHGDTPAARGRQPPTGQKPPIWSRMQQMTVAIDDVAGHADRAAQAAQGASRKAGDGRLAVSGVRNEIGTLAEHIEGTDAWCRTWRHKRSRSIACWK